MQNEPWRLIKQQNSVWIHTSGNDSNGCLCLHTTHMPHDHAFLKYKMEYYIYHGNLLWMNYNWSICLLHPLSMHVWLLEQTSRIHSFPIMCQDRTMSPTVKRFPKTTFHHTHLPRGCLAFPLSLSLLSFSLPSLSSSAAWWKRTESVLAYFMTRIILVLFDKAELDWGLIELFL